MAKEFSCVTRCPFRACRRVCVASLFRACRPFVFFVVLVRVLSYGAPMHVRVLPLPLMAAVALSACSPRQIGMSRMADALTETASSYGRDNDPEFVRVAAPATLKMVEMLLDDSPRHAGLLMTACSGFTQYAYAFLQVESEIVQHRDAALGDELRTRARAMYERARDYCLRALEVRHQGFSASVRTDPTKALSGTTEADVPALFWLGASWGGAFSLAENQLRRLAELAAVRAILARAISLDEDWEDGAIHETLIALEGLPPLLGGSRARARSHFQRAVELSGGRSAFPYVTLAASVALPAKDRVQFERLLKEALAVDVDARPALRLANLIAQKRARFLLGRMSELFGS